MMRNRKVRNTQIALIVAVVFTSIAMWASYRYVILLAQQQMDSETAKVRQSFSSSVLAAEGIAESFQALMEAVQDPSEAQFQSFANPSIQNNKFLRSAQYYRRVKESERKQFEARLLTRGIKDGIVETKNDDQVGPAGKPKKEAYGYLALWLSDVASAEHLYFGWDLLSDSIRSKAAFRAISSGRITASDSFLLDDGHAAIDVFVPIVSASNKSDVRALVALTIDLPALLGSIEWRKSVTVRMATTLSGETTQKILFRSLDQNPAKGLILTTLTGRSSVQSFGHNLEVLFERGLDFRKVNSGLFLMVLFGCLALGALGTFLARTLADLSGSLEELARVNAGLEKTIVDRTRDLQNVLDNLSQGFMTFDKDGIIGKGVSRGATDFFGALLTGKYFFDVVQLDSIQRRASQEWLSMVFSGESLLSFEDLKPLGPGVFKDAKDRYIQLSYFPIPNLVGKGLDRVICVATDCTSEKKLEHQLKMERAQAGFILKVVKDRSIFRDFALETKKALSDLISVLSAPAQRDEMSSLLRTLHTVKGGAAFFDLIEIADGAHVLESQLKEYESTAKELSEELRKSLLAKIENIKDSFETILENNAEITGPLDDSVKAPRTISSERLIEWYRKLADLKASRLAQDFAEEFILEDAAHWLMRYEPLVQKVAEQLDKEVKLTIKEPGPRAASNAYRGLITSFVHIFRNSVDHGLETREEREALKKDPVGHIEVEVEGHEAANEPPRLRFIIRDDGGGIPIQLVRKKVVEKGLLKDEEQAAKTDQEIVQMVFASGFSTRDAVSELSGRGVGLEAVSFEAKSLGGKVYVESTEGRGASFFIDVLWYREIV